MKKYPDQSYLRQVFDYNPDTGELRWRERRDIADETDCRQWNIKFAGKIAGCLNPRGYRVLTINGITYYVHRLIWKLVYGKEPTQLTDHRNCIKDDNRLQNLREANHNQNAQNRKPRKDKKSGLPKGVVPNYDKGEARYQVSVLNGNYIGVYKTVSEAQRSYRIHARRLFGEYARHS